MNRTKAGFAIAAMSAAQFAAPATGQDEPAPHSLIEAAFAKIRTATPDIAAASLACSASQRQMVVLDGSQLRYPCMLQDIVTDSGDAAMVVTLLLSDAAAVDSDPTHSGSDPSDGFAGEHDPALKDAQSAYVARGSETFRADVIRSDRLREEDRGTGQSDDLARRRAEARRLEAQEQAAAYQAVTRFLELADAQAFCPAEGRAFLARAIQYSTSPLEQDRMVGLWADAHRHALEPYLNDLSRCR
ncbi:hypothetical protein K3172_09475 [Qipengyuania sp. 6B39]|uniref:hypothetical protein n=1 Tax=Qipengyuania proteolytica TaxID=2867239 RepID=UPI001C8937F2|nr:hypothetical protein [Qipengyuania proteolytica]MBX7496081.1 hypothetical protein [Qipengyuania proteolytica]